MLVAAVLALAQLVCGLWLCVLRVVRRLWRQLSERGIRGCMPCELARRIQGNNDV